MKESTPIDPVNKKHEQVVDQSTRLGIKPFPYVDHLYELTIKGVSYLAPLNILLELSGESSFFSADPLGPPNKEQSSMY